MRWHYFSRDDCYSLLSSTTFIIHCSSILRYYKYPTWINVHWHFWLMFYEFLCSQSGKYRQLWNILSISSDDWCQCNFNRNSNNELFWILAHRNSTHISDWLWYQSITPNECHYLQSTSPFFIWLDIHEWWHYWNFINFFWCFSIMWLEWLYFKTLRYQQ